MSSIRGLIVPPLTVSKEGSAQVAIVKKGQSLGDIAKSSGVGIEDLMRANPQIKDSENVAAGTEVRLPEKGTVPVNGRDVDPGKTDSCARSQQDRFANLMLPSAPRFGTSASETPASSCRLRDAFTSPLGTEAL